MTPQEHKLILLMFSKQSQHIKTLLNILKSKGILEDDDAQAYSYATRTDAPANAALVREVAMMYAEFATKVGLDPLTILQEIVTTDPE